VYPKVQRFEVYGLTLLITNIITTLKKQVTYIRPTRVVYVDVQHTLSIM
jgi:hypothetical protein